MSEQFAAYQTWIGFAFDMLIVIGIVVLWGLWRRSSERQANVEAMLHDAASQLEEASQTLSKALTQIQQLQEAEPKQAPRDMPEAKVHKSTQSEVSGPVAQLLELHRQGVSDENIAREMGMPLAQVRLMIRLHSAGVSGS